MGFVLIPVIRRITRPSIAGIPVWYAEAAQARTQLDISITIPRGTSRKLIVLWGSDGGEFPTAVMFDPAGVAIPMIPTDGAFDEIGDLRVGAYYLDTPPIGSWTVRIATANAVWSVASLKVYQNARAGGPQAASEARAGTRISILIDEDLLLEANSETTDIVLGDGLPDGGLTPELGQTAGADDVINSSFLATTSTRTHRNDSGVTQGWAAASSVDLLHAVVNILFSPGHVATGSFQPLAVWELDASGTTFPDSLGRSSAAVSSGLAAGGAAPLLADGGTSVSVQGATITAAHHVDWQVSSWTLEAYFQPRSLPRARQNRPIIGKDSGLPVPGGPQLELYNDRGTGRIRAYIRDATGLIGTGIFVGSATGDGSVALDTAHVVHMTYDDQTKTASVYLDRSLLVSKTDQRFAGLENNTSPISIGCRFATAGVEQDGVIDRVTFGLGVMTAAEIAARPAPVTITDPNAPGAITAVDDNVGDVPPGTTKDVDVLANDTGKTGPHFDIEIVSDPAGHLSVINDRTANARIRIATPVAPSSTMVQSGTYRVSEGSSPAFGNPSNQATISWRRPGTGGRGGYTPFPFATVANPRVTHRGVAARPDHNASNPLNSSIIDPMSGIEIVRVGGNSGANVLINGATDSGLNFPRCLRNENSPRVGNVWNADGSLLVIGRRFAEAGDPSDAASAYILDTTGAMTGAPFRIVRASASVGLGVGQWWFWDPLNPLRAYIIRNSGQLDEWWPIGGSGHDTGEINTIRGATAGFTDHNQGRRHMINCSWDGLHYISGCRRTSGNRWGGIRINLQTGDLGPFIPTPDTNNEDSDRSSQGTSATGLYTSFSPNGNRHRFARADTGQIVSDTGQNAMSHIEMTIVNGIEYAVGGHSDATGLRLFNIATGEFSRKATIPMQNPQHTGCTNTLDLFQTHGPAVGGTSGQRYGIFTKSNDRGGFTRGIMGIRLGPNDNNQIRYICNHRGVRTSNRNEIHSQISPNGRMLVFPSNWMQPGVTTDGQVHPYVALIPDAWWSPNNDGS